MDGMDGFSSLIPKDDGDIALVVKTLFKWHCCPRCVLRFLGERDQHTYKKSNDQLLKWLNEYKVKGSIETQLLSNGDNVKAGPVSDVNKVGLTFADNPCSSEGTDTDFVCVSCIGILQTRYCSDEFCQELLRIIRKEDYEFDSYYMSLSIPVPLMVREYALFVKLKELFPNVYDDTVKDDITPIKDAWKWATGSTMSHLLRKPFDQKSQFEVKLNFFHPDLERECHFLFDVFPDVFCRRKNNKHGWEVFTRVNVPKALDDLGDKRLKKYYQCPPKRKQLPCDCDPIVCSHESVYIAGRYNKYSRTLSQTPWVVEGERRTESSVEEMICVHVKEAFMCKDYKLAASGREDVDVLMLGRGRPFVVEIINPRRIHFTLEMMKALQDKINTTHSEVKVRDLQMVTRQETTNLKKGEEEKIKHYSALCSIDKSIDQCFLDSILTGKHDLVIKQKTPVRVLHRRALAVRDRTIHKMSTELKDDRHFLLKLATQAGTYIKEFVHGDFGRTVPNLGTLLHAECDILQLNVDAVELDWPKQLDDLDT